MKVFVQNGCVNWAREVDDVDVNEMSEEDAKQTIMKLASYIPVSSISRFVEWFGEEFGEYYCDHEPCEQCGDFTETYNWNNEKTER